MALYNRDDATVSHPHQSDHGVSIFEHRATIRPTASLIRDTEGASGRVRERVNSLGAGDGLPTRTESSPPPSYNAGGPEQGVASLPNTFEGVPNPGNNR